VMEGKVAIVEYLLEKGARDSSQGGSRRWNQSTSTWVGEDGASLGNGNISLEVVAKHRESIIRLARAKAADKSKASFQERVANISRNHSRLNLDGLSSSRRSSLNMESYSPPQSPLTPLSRTTSQRSRASSRGRSPLRSPRVSVSEEDMNEYINMQQRSRF